MQEGLVDCIGFKRRLSWIVLYYCERLAIRYLIKLIVRSILVVRVLS